MARPTKPTSVRVGHQTLAEKQARQEGEAKLRGNGGKPTPPKYLTDEQKKIFRTVVRELEPSGVLCKLDSDILVSYAVAKSALNDINSRTASDPDLLTDKEMISARRQFSTEYFRCLNELGLSPQSRAKMANMTAQAQVKDPLLEALQSTPEDEGEEASAESFDSTDGNITIVITDGFSGDDAE